MKRSSFADALKKFASWVTCVALAAAVAGQTPLSPGEVRLSSRPYSPQSPIRVETRLVELEVVVRDTHGRAVAGLTKDDFVVFDSKKNRDITSFSVATFNPPDIATPKPANSQPDIPVAPVASAPNSTGPTVSKGRSILLLFDDINTPPGELAQVKIAARRFIKEAAASGDHIAVFTTTGLPNVNFTGDTAEILTALTRVQSHLRISPNGLAACPRITPYEAYRIVHNDQILIKEKMLECAGTSSLPGSGVYTSDIPVAVQEVPVKAQAELTWNQARAASQATLDAIMDAIHQVAKQPGTRMLLLSSSGFLSGTLEEQQDGIINAAVRAGVVINSLDAKGMYAETPGTPINERVETVEPSLASLIFQVEYLGDRLESVDSAMAQIAESTGGLLFRNNNDLDLGFHQLGVLPSATYLLGFPPAEDGQYHKIKVELKNANHRFVQVRPGYFAPSSAQSSQSSPVDNVDAEMHGSAEKTDVPATNTEKFSTAVSGSPEVTIQTHIDIQKLPFQEQKDRHVQKLTFAAALFDLQGKFVTGKQAEMELALKPESFDRFSRTGINGVMQLEAPAGTYRLRMVVQEAVNGKMSATSKEIRIP